MKLVGQPNKVYTKLHECFKHAEAQGSSEQYELYGLKAGGAVVTEC